MCRLKNFLSTHILRVLYNSLILSHLLKYSNLAWGVKIGRLDKSQKLYLLKAKDLFELNALKLFTNIRKVFHTFLHFKYVFRFLKIARL